MFDKRAMELPLNFIVILIISLIIFGFGIAFISTLSSQAKDIADLTFDELDQRISDVICEGSERVCIGIDRKKILKKEFGVFGLKIFNILEPPLGKSGQDFDIMVAPSNPLGFTKDKTPITGIPLLINPASRTVPIKQNEEAVIGIGIQVPSDAVSGTYIFNVEIKTFIEAEAKDKEYVPIQKLYVDVP